jgi:uncharacterized protein YndB with AHSA1/START domain
VIDQHEATTARATVTVECTQQHAFDVFTSGFNTWWNRAHHIGTADLDAAIMEPRKGGRWYERGVDGSECEWGRVLEFDPPERLLLCWQLTAQFQYDPDFETEVEVRFVAETPTRTRVELEHRNLDRFGLEAEQMKATFGSEGGWTGLLALFGAEASR